MDGPLDMRMQKETEVDSGITAAYIVNNYDEKTIADILFNYGDEKCSRKLAREIVACRPILTTGKLVEVLSRVTPWKERTKMLARCFQALRIEVNDEIGALEEALNNSYKIVKPSGRLVIMSYHSLEDKRVKSLLKNGFPDEKYASSSNFENPWNSLFKKAVIPSDEEITLNKRARSAKLRVGERVSVGEELLASNPYTGILESRKSKYTPGLVGEKQKNKFLS
jgi:16S rRNA (cytosine1402-N4)-methyltransferase